MDVLMESVNCNTSVNLTRLQRNISNTPSAIDMNLLSSAKATVIFKCAVASTIGVIGFFGNVLTLTAIRTTSVLRTKSNRLIAALSAWELLLEGPIVMCFTTTQVLAYVVSNQPCRYRTVIAIITPIQKLPFYACHALFMAIALDRYIAVVYPLHYEAVVTETRMNYAIGACSLFAVAIGIVQLSWLLTVNWSSCDIPYSLLMHFVFDFGFYVSGILVMVLVYGRILLIALQHRRKIDCNPAYRLTGPICGNPVTETSTITAPQTQSQTGRTKSTKGEFKAARMTATVIGSYTICWLTFIIGRGLQLSGIRAQYAQNLVDVGSALGTASVSLDWVIYGMMNRSFRKAFLRILCKRNKSVIGEIQTTADRLGMSSG